MGALKNREGMEENGMGGLHEAAGPVTEGWSARDGVLEGILARRERHRERSVFVRAGVVVAGGAVGLFAAVLSVVVPEVGLPLLLFSLRLLALEYDWAARLYARVSRLARRAAGTFGRLWARSKVSVVVVVVALVVVAALVLLG